MGADPSTPPAPPAQQPLDCPECGTRKEHESRELMNTAGKKELEETGSRWMNTISTKVHGFFGLNVEQEVSQKESETTSQTNTGKVQRDFNVCPNPNCDQHFKDRWEIRSWELEKNSNSENLEEIKWEERDKLKKQIKVNSMVLNNEEKPSLDPSDFSSSNKTDKQSSDTDTNDTSTDSSNDKSTDESAGFSDRVRSWWADNRVRQWISGDSDDTRSTTDDSTNADTTTATTATRSPQTTNEQTSLWEYATDTKTDLSSGTVGQERNADIDSGAGMGSSTSESEEFDNDRSNSV